MRKIAFRGKRKDNGKWVYGYYSPVNIPILGYQGHYINEGGYRAIEIDENTVGQYTGLKDKNGVEIYEGDICACFGGTQIFSVEYCEERFGYFFDDCVICGDAEPMPECLGNLRNTIEVIGNIYDNPELLKGE